MFTACPHPARPRRRNQPDCRSGLRSPVSSPRRVGGARGHRGLFGAWRMHLRPAFPPLSLRGEVSISAVVSCSHCKRFGSFGCSAAQLREKSIEISSLQSWSSKEWRETRGNLLAQGILARDGSSCATVQLWLGLGEVMGMFCYGPVGVH